MAKMKLPKDIKKKLDEWKFASGAAVLCLVAYSDGTEIQAFQFVLIYPLMAYFLTHFQRREFSYCQ
jgi:hypothetical protein